MKIQILQIKVNEGRREIGQKAVQGLVDSVSEVGLLPLLCAAVMNTLLGFSHWMSWERDGAGVIDIPVVAAVCAGIEC